MTEGRLPASFQWVKLDTDITKPRLTRLEPRTSHEEMAKNGP